MESSRPAHTRAREDEDKSTQSTNYKAQFSTKAPTAGRTASVDRHAQHDSEGGCVKIGKKLSSDFSCTRPGDNTRTPVHPYRQRALAPKRSTCTVIFTCQVRHFFHRAPLKFSKLNGAPPPPQLAEQYVITAAGAAHAMPCHAMRRRKQFHIPQN